MRHRTFVLTAGVAIILAVVSAYAQHTLAAKFDLTKPLTLKGTVTQVDWSNPYVHILMKVPGTGTSRPTLWAVELDSAVLLTQRGWTETTLPLGETITVQGFAARDKSNQISGGSVTTSGGKKLFAGS